MANPGETIQGLEICIENIDKVECPEECPYYEKCMAYDRRCVFQPLLRDTLAILKAQQERIKELEELLHEGGCDGINACDVKACPYYNASHVQLEETKDEKIRELQKEIHKLKAAQEPRVMTLEEVKEWAEMSILERQKRKPMFCEKRTGECGWVHNPAIPKDYYIYALDGQCRYWTDQPTDEQREAVSWQ